jgi:hypothetical protein
VHPCGASLHGTERREAIGLVGELYPRIARTAEHLINHCFTGLSGKPVMVILQESGPFWSSLVQNLERVAGCVMVLEESADCPSVDRLIPKPLGGGRFFLPQIGEYEAALTIVTSPLRIDHAVDSMAVREGLLALHRSKHPTAYVEWPAGMSHPWKLESLEVRLNQQGGRQCTSPLLCCSRP